MPLRRLLRSEQLLLMVLAVVVGAAAAYGAIAFRFVAVNIQTLFFGNAGDTLYQSAAALPAWELLAAPALGGLAIGLFVHFVMPAKRPLGVADTIEAAALRSGRMGIRSALGAAAVSAASIGVGASVGREGPVVHLGAALSSWLARVLGLGRLLTVTLLGCGVAAAVAASFNAPIAGVFFALEVVIGHYALTAFAPIVISSVIGTIISRIHFGDFPAFFVPGDSITSFLELPAFAILGVVCAVVAVMFMRSTAVVQKTSDNAVRVTHLPRWMHPMFGGLLVGLIALVFPQVLGVGYGATNAALNNSLELWLLIALVAAKMAAASISLGTGFGGGVFSPSLFLGAMVGGAFGIVATSAFPELSSGTTAYTLVGMGAVAGAVLGAPISTILIVFELTGDYAVTIVVMVAVVIASMITEQFYGKSFFTWQLEQRGLNVTGGREQSLLASTHVGDVMRREFASVPMEAHLDGVREKLQAAPHGQVFVVDAQGALYGEITFPDLADAAFDTGMDTLVTASDVARVHPPVLAEGTDLAEALKLMESEGEEYVAVVENTDSQKLIGVINEVDVMLVYNRAILRARAEERGEM